jgi:hypothetical protein
MSKRKNLYAVLGAAGALALLLGAVGGVSVVSAQEVTPESEESPTSGLFTRGRGMFGFGRGSQWTMFDTAADVLGLTPDELFDELRGGATMEDVAEAQEVDVEQVQEALQAAQEEARLEAIEQAVEDGDMSQEQADWMLEGLEQGYMPRGRGFGRGMRGGFDSFSPRSDQSTPTVPSSSSP